MSSVDHQMEFDQRVIAERLGQGTPGIIITDGTDEYATRAERHQIAGNVACAADHRFHAFDGNDRRRRLWRNTGDLAIDKLIQHQISDAEHGLVCEFRKMFVEIVHRFTGSGRHG